MLLIKLMTKKPIFVFLHQIAHKLGWYPGYVTTWWEGDTLMVGYRCSECGKIEGIAKTPFKREEY